MRIFVNQNSQFNTLYYMIMKSYLLPVLVSTVFACTGTTMTAQDHAFTREDFTRAAESAVNGVVSVKSYATPRTAVSSESMFNDPFFEFFFGQPLTPYTPRQQQPQTPKQRQVGLGSGVIISADGYIVTNNHVIENAERLEVTLNDNRNFKAEVIGADPVTDLALIKIDSDNLHTIPMGDSENLRVGEWVLAVGNPFGFTSSVTTGIVSAKARNISSSTGSQSHGGIESYIQTDAAVNQGNSGGALVNLDGELVGINTAIYSQNGAYVGCSFAIPTSIVHKVVDDLRTYGVVQRAYLGIIFSELTPESIEQKNLKDVTAGVYVEDVEDLSAAREADIRKGDVIISMNGRPTLSKAQLQEIVARLSPGDVANIVLIRDGKNIVKQITLRNRKGDTSLTRQGQVSELGCTFRDLTDEECNKYEISKGVIIDSITDGRFRDAGLKAGTVIVSINGVRVRTASDIKKIFDTIMKDDDDKVMFIKALNPDGKAIFKAVPLVD